VRGSYFEGNSANYAGAIINFGTAGSLLTIEDCVFLANSSLVGYGGALSHHFDGSVLVDRSRFVANSAAQDGGAILFAETGTVRNSTFNANTSASNDGGGIKIADGQTALIQGSTFTGNQGGAVVEGLAVTFGTMVNCIAWANTPFELSAQVGVSYSDVMGGYGGVGNLDVDPLFDDRLGPDGIPGTLDDDLSLFGASPCIDAGNANAAAFPYPMDLAGRPRVVNHPGIPDTGLALVGQSIDLGAYEVQRRGAFIEQASPRGVNL